MSQNDIQKIKERLGIKELIESYIKVEKSGKNFKARCPFHNEKTPSFYISPDRDNYYCFGCGAKGDILTFVQEFENVDFSEALKNLAEKTGVKISSYSKESESKSKKMYEILEITTAFYEKNLSENKEAIQYLKLRGLTEETIKEWRLGFALSGWRTCYEFLKDKGFTEDQIEKVGLIKKGDKGDSYDRLRSRIMFPIFDASGRPIAFTGRIFGSEDDTAKYINSPETELFKKSDILFGFDRAKTSIRKNNFSILVEGQMDTLMCHQAGYINTIASSGTALTENQLKNMSRLSNRMVIAYDSDNAGFKASERAWEMALSFGMDIKIAPIPKGSDPADVIKDSPEEWKSLIKKSKHIIELLIDKIENEEEDSREKGHLVSERLIPYLVQIKSEIDRSHFVKKISERFKIPEDAIYNEIKIKKGATKNMKPTNNLESSTIRKKDEMSVEKRLFGIVSWQESIKDSSIDTESIKTKIKEIVGIQEYDNIFESVKGVLEDIIYAVEITFENKVNLDKEVDELLQNLNLKYLNNKREKLVLSLKKAEGDKDEEKENELLKQISDISKEIQKISQTY